jgi:hypothetical protein
LAFASPSQSLTVQDRAGSADGTCSASGVTQVNSVVQLNAERLLVNGTVPRVGIGLPVADSPGGLLSIDATNSNTPKILFENQAGETADAAITTIDDTGGTDICIGSNVYINSAGFLTRFNTSEESSYVYVSKTGQLFLGTGDTAATASTRLNIDKNGNVKIGNNSAADTQLSVECDTTGEAIGDGIRIQNAHGVNGDIAPVYFGVHGGTRRAKAAIGLKRTGSYGVGELRFAVDSNDTDTDVNFADDTKLTIASTGAITASVTAGSAQALTVTGGNNAVGNICALFRSNDNNSWVNVRNNGQLHTTGGLVFDNQTDTSATGAAATSTILDHYEVGTFLLTDGSGAGLTLTGGAGKYTRIGNRVFISAQFSMPSVTNSNHMTLEGLPFNTDNDDDSRGLSIAYAGTSNIAYSLTVANTSKVSFYTSAGVNASNTNGSGAAFWLNGHYRVA